jgi:hypothetical protein
MIDDRPLQRPAVGIYRSLRVEMVYDAEKRTVEVKIRPLGGPVNVSEGICALTTPGDRLNAHAGLDAAQPAWTTQ